MARTGNGEDAAVCRAQIESVTQEGCKVAQASVVHHHTLWSTGGSTCICEKVVMVMLPQQPQHNEPLQPSPAQSSLM